MPLPALDTDRLTLRAHGIEDFEDMCRMWSDPRVVRFIGGKVRSREQVWARLLRHALADGAKGIVLEALGRGNVPPAMLDGVREASAAGVPVVVASRCAAGTTAPQYGYEGGGVTLAEAGAIFAGDLTPPKARIKLMVLLGSGADVAAIRASFSR